MTEKTRLWQVDGDSNLISFKEDDLDYEDKLENWVKDDVSILGDDLLLIGKQVAT